MSKKRNSEIEGWRPCMFCGKAGTNVTIRFAYSHLYFADASVVCLGCGKQTLFIIPHPGNGVEFSEKLLHQSERPMLDYARHTWNAFHDPAKWRTKPKEADPWEKIPITIRKKQR